MRSTLEFVSKEAAKRYADKARLTDYLILYDDYDGSYGIYLQWQRGSWFRLTKRVRL